MRKVLFFLTALFLSTNLFSARLSIYLEVEDPASTPLWFHLDRISLSKNGNSWVSFRLDKEVSSREIGRGQKLIGTFTLEEGSYRFIKLRFGKAALLRGEEMRFLSIDSKELVLPINPPINLSPTSSSCLFISWNLKRSLKGVFLFLPSMSAQPQRIPLRTELLYVSCDNIDTIYIVDCSSNHVIGSIGIPSPKGISLVKPQNMLYVVSQKDRTIYAVELSTNRVVSDLPLPGSMAPLYIATNPRMNRAYITDPSLNYIFMVDLESGVVLRKKRLISPYFLVYDEKGDVLYVTSRKNQSLLALNPSDLSERFSIQVGDEPEGILVYEKYVCSVDRGSGSITVYDTEGKNLFGKVNICPEPRRIVAWKDRVYVSCYSENRISIVIPNHFVPFKSIPTGKGPLELSFCPLRSWLYVSERRGRSIGVIDITTDTYTYSIPLGGAPFQLATLY